ncbi:MAG: ATP-binding protein [Acidobacteriota bacterium]|jgi:nitrogen fixation/metabolism regulation signal transduction histidine kinase
MSTTPSLKEPKEPVEPPAGNGNAGGFLVFRHAAPGASRLGRRGLKVSYDSQVVISALAAGLPAVLASMLLLWLGGYTPKVEWTLTVIILSFWFGFSFALRTRVVRPLQTISNLLAALREGDFSIRARGYDRSDTLGDVMAEINALGATLQEQRLGAVEATALLGKVVQEIDVAVFAFDSGRILKLINRAGERLLAQPSDRLVEHTAAELGLTDCLEAEESRLLEISFPGGSGRWELRRTTFRQDGLPHQLLVLSDMTRALREEERQVWKRLIRVLGHELNNSLAPIRSIAASLGHLLARNPRPADWLEDMHKGLAIISNRGEALSRFMEGYSRLSHLPPPHCQPLDVRVWVRRAAGLETRVAVSVIEGPALIIQADGDQLDQLLINLLRNGADAATVTGGSVSVGWTATAAQLELWVEDEGPGLPITGNLFVPFFTTKPHGSGIGLVLCRQIAEAHDGSLTLVNRSDRQGCRALLRLPIRHHERA